MSDRLKTVGETLIDILEANGVDTVFGIPGVHTVELYRGLASSAIRHVTPRHEQGAGFMADGYARVSGKPGVCLVITGPGLTNIITPMAQAYQDSVPLLVISGVNARATLGHGRGRLHELPDQHGMMATLALMSHTLHDPDDLAEVMERAFFILGSGRPGPVHIEIPTDVMALPVRQPPQLKRVQMVRPRADEAAIGEAGARCLASRRPVILVGGGAVSAAPQIQALAERLDAPLVTTTNARGAFSGHPLSVPASPSLEAVRQRIADADLVLAFGTQMGQTDYDMYADNGFPVLESLIRIDIDPAQLARGPQAALSILSSAESAAADLLATIGSGNRLQGDGAKRADTTRQAAWAELTPKMQVEIGILDKIRDTLPGAIIVGDSTQAVYAGNLYYEADRPNGWFNAATGYGALGYGPPAAIGAAIADTHAPVVCLAGDGGLQFTLAEIGSAKDAGANVIFLVWNNDGYGEIESYMVENGIEPEGVKPSAPDFLKIAEAYGLPAKRLAHVDELRPALIEMRRHAGPSLIEIHQTKTVGATA